jgi:YggT family protein
MILEIYTFIIIGFVIVSWLLAFNVISTSHPAVKKLVGLLGRLTDPVMRPVQRYIPTIGGIDLSPIIIIFAIMFLQGMIIRLFAGAAF